MNEQDVKALVESVVSKKKSKWSYNQAMAMNKDYNKPDYPDYYPTYAMAVELAEANRYHTEKGVFPGKLFASKSPYQTDAELVYIKENYKQITLPIAIDFINTISTAFNEGNYSISYAEDNGVYKKTDFQEYVEKGIYTYGSIENFMKFLFPTLKTIDANGVIAIKPYFVITKNENDEEVISSTEFNEPQPLYYDCSKVVAYKEESYCLIDTTNYSKNTSVYTYELYDRENIWAIVYDEKKNKDAKVTVALYYNHAWEQLPVTRIKGIPRVIDGEIVWQSVFSFASDIMDLIALDNSTLTIAKHKSAFPIRVYEGKACAFQYKDKEGNISTCNEGHVYDTTLGKDINCPNCQGIGLVDRFSPLHDFITAPSDSKFADGQANKVPFQYVAPGTQILEFLENSIAKNEERARKILHIQNSNSVIKGTENLTATGMALGDKSRSAFVKPISDQMFDVWQFILDATGWMRYKDAFQSPVINKAKNFDFNTEYDYVLEISTASKAGLPPVMIHAIVYRYMKSHFFSDEKSAKAFNLIIAADRLIGNSIEDIDFSMSKNTVAGWEKILHDSGITLIDSLVRANAKFFEQDLSKQVEQLHQAAKDIEKANKPVSNTQNVIGEVLNSGGGIDNLGKLPLALQQLGLAVQRADEAGNKALSKKLQDKMAELVKEI